MILMLSCNWMVKSLKARLNGGKFLLFSILLLKSSGGDSINKNSVYMRFCMVNSSEHIIHEHVCLYLFIQNSFFNVYQLCLILCNFLSQGP